jgi:hypothetical protein
MDKRPPRDRSDSTEASAGKPLTKAEAAKAMDRFKNLTRTLLNVPREKLNAEQQRYEQSKAKGRPQKGG